MRLVRGVHHLALAVGHAQEDYDFHTQVLGLRSVKKTVRIVGRVPVYHLFYGNAGGDPGSLLTTMPYGRVGFKGRRGSNQVKVINLAVPPGSLPFWARRLDAFGIGTAEAEWLGRERLLFAHPCGIEYAFVETPTVDASSPWEVAGVTARNAIRRVHGATISTLAIDEMSEFLVHGLGAVEAGRDGSALAFRCGARGRSGLIELIHEPGREPGTWKFGSGTVHRLALDVGTCANLLEVKDWLEGLGYCDVSEPKSDRYYSSCFVRTPSGVMLELTAATELGLLADEEPQSLGEVFHLPEDFEGRPAELMAALDPIELRDLIVPETGGPAAGT
ncbi:MAG TPA: hypothetical protein VFG42_19715 [Baekduia sp.]|uniref:hypothetical protein n=1 Tax=Baekduia sp. TaxID=2600305 RepID=UPI002D76DB2A|nr:hypothetical protein [Baekduia sp.]HET6509031.1 hypothetical protein [Baekduia sp.]